MHSYESTLNETIPSVEFGYTAIRIYRSDELAGAQLGYSVNPDGVSLIGQNDGDWHSNWLVIGNEELCGEPIFIDTSQPGFPVYNAMHGQGRWDPEPLAVSLAALRESLSALAEIAKGREDPIALEQNPLPEAERNGFLATVRRLNPGIDISFWEQLVSGE